MVGFSAFTFFVTSVIMVCKHRQLHKLKSLKCWWTMHQSSKSEFCHCKRLVGSYTQPMSDYTLNIKYQTATKHFLKSFWPSVQGSYNFSNLSNTTANTLTRNNSLLIKWYDCHGYQVFCSSKSSCDEQVKSNNNFTNEYTTCPLDNADNILDWLNPAHVLPSTPRARTHFFPSNAWCVWNSEK
jgi:hypothetical protein